MFRSPFLTYVVVVLRVSQGRTPVDREQYLAARRPGPGLLEDRSALVVAGRSRRRVHRNRRRSPGWARRSGGSWRIAAGVRPSFLFTLERSARRRT